MCQVVITAGMLSNLEVSSAVSSTHQGWPAAALQPLVFDPKNRVPLSYPPIVRFCCINPASNYSSTYIISLTSCYSLLVQEWELLLAILCQQTYVWVGPKL